MNAPAGWSASHLFASAGVLLGFVLACAAIYSVQGVERAIAADATFEERGRWDYGGPLGAGVSDDDHLTSPQPFFRRMGEALLRLLADLEVPHAQKYLGQPLTYPAAFAIAAHHWNVSPAAALKGLMWTIVEGQVAALLRLVKLGHTAGQRILISAVPVIERAVATARALEDDEIGNVSVAMAMASAWHETQYSRLFRS